FFLPSSPIPLRFSPLSLYPCFPLPPTRLFSPSSIPHRSLLKVFHHRPKGSLVTSRPGANHFSGPLHHRSTILSTLGLPFPHGFVFRNSRATDRGVSSLVPLDGSAILVALVGVDGCRVWHCGDPDMGFVVSLPR
ncbi:hypothetical protein DVH24_026434, partial [Malus domestica]